MRLPSISDALKVITASTEEAIIAKTELDWGTLPKKVYFMHGHPKEITNVLQAYTNSDTHADKKYPLVCLFRDIRETIGQNACGPGVEFNPRIVICTITDPNLRADQREEQNFKPILLPIFEEFVNQITLSSAFGMPTLKDLRIVKWDRYFWGSQLNDSNQFNDHIDAVEIESISLQLLNQIS